MNKTINCRLTRLEIRKKEVKPYQGNDMYYLFCNSFDIDGMASGLKVKVDVESYTGVKVGDVISCDAVATSKDWIGINGLNLAKTK